MLRRIAVFFAKEQRSTCSRGKVGRHWWKQSRLSYSAKHGRAINITVPVHPRVVVFAKGGISLHRHRQGKRRERSYVRLSTRGEFTGLSQVAKVTRVYRRLEFIDFHARHDMRNTRRTYTHNILYAHCHTVNTVKRAALTLDGRCGWNQNILAVCDALQFGQKARIGMHTIRIRESVTKMCMQSIQSQSFYYKRCLI